MKRKLLTLGAALLFGGAAYSQNYYEVGSQGSLPDIDLNAGPPANAATVMSSASGSINDKLSAQQSLPFSWNFYGQSVKNFKISDNGYITFDAGATTSVSANTTLPDPSAPKNAIFAFWDDLQLTSFPGNGTTYNAYVFTWTYGTAPNRTFVVFWYQVGSASIAAGAANTAYEALRIHENGGFDVVNAYNTGNFSATIGATNADGSVGYSMTGSPSIGSTSIFNGTYNAATSPVYNFIYGVQQSFDAGVIKLDLPKIVATTEQTAIAGTITNFGSTQITSLDLNYSVDGGATVTQSLSGLAIDPSGGTYDFTHGTAWTGATPGQFHTIKVWATNINGNADQNTDNDAMTRTVFVNNGVYADKKILLEEGTGAWCGWCPVGHYNIKQILEDPANAGKLIPVSLHNNDGMHFAQDDSINAVFQVGFPYLMIDRFSFPELYGKVGNGNYISPQVWSDRVATRMANAKSPVKVDVVDKEVASDGTISITVKANFVDYAAGNLRLNCYIIEDSMRGPDAQNVWTQHNYASKLYNAAGYAGTDHPLYNEDQWLVGYKHMHVLRACPSGAWGTAGLIPSVVSPNTTYTYTYKYKPSKPVNVSYTTSPVDPLGLTNVTSGVGQNNIDNMKIVVFVSNYDKNDITNNEILNANQTSLLGWASGLNEIASKNVADIQVYPNPTEGVTTANFTLTKGDQAVVTVMNELGQKVETLSNGFMQAGNNTIRFDASKYNNGVYFLNINTGGESITHRFVVVK